MNRTATIVSLLLLPGVSGCILDREIVGVTITTGGDADESSGSDGPGGGSNNPIEPTTTTISSTTNGVDPDSATTAVSTTEVATTEVATTAVATTEASTTATATTETSTTGGSTTDLESTGGSTTEPDTACGDGLLDPGELCDDGNGLSGDGCLPDCTPGNGAALGPLDVPPPGPTAYRTCLTLVDGADDPRGEHGLVLGGPLAQFGPDGQEAAHVERFPLPTGNPLTWSWADHAGPNDRSIEALATAENGDILAAGTVYTDPQQLGGFLWLARFTAQGELVWLQDHGSIASSPEDLAASPSGDILVAARVAGWAPGAKGAWVQAFDADGQFLWQHDAPTANEWALRYNGITVDNDGTIYATGRGGPSNALFEHLVLESFAADGAPLWQTELPAPGYTHAEPSDIVVTTAGVLVVAMTQGHNPNSVGDESGLAAFTTGGALLWWQDLPAHGSWKPAAGPIVAAPNGGVFVAWGDVSNEDSGHARIARYGASGQLLWSIDPAGAVVQDAAFGADGLLYTLQGSDVHRYEP